MHACMQHICAVHIYYPYIYLYIYMYVCAPSCRCGDLCRFACCYCNRECMQRGRPAKINNTILAGVFLTASFMCNPIVVKSPGQICGIFHHLKKKKKILLLLLFCAFAFLQATCKCHTPYPNLYLIYTLICNFIHICSGLSILAFKSESLQLLYNSSQF